MKDGLYKDLTYKVIGAGMNVHNTLGPGFLEKVYQKALEKELADQNINFAAQSSHTVQYKNISVGIYRSDLTIENVIIVEIKAVSDVDLNLAAAQLISYLSATKYMVGLLINFGKEKLEYKRIILPKKLQQ